MGAFEEFIYKRFGIALEGYAVEEHTNKVYIYSPTLAGVDARCIQRKGILAGKLDTLYGIKPSLDFVLVFGHLAVKNVVRLDDGKVRDVYMNRAVECAGECTDGLAIIQDMRGRGAGIALCKGGTLYPLTPKERMIAPA